MLQDFGDAYASATTGWLVPLLPIAQRLFLLLATLELTWSGIWWALASRRGDDHVLVPILRKVVHLMFFYTLLLLAPIWIPTLVGSFARAGQVASGYDRLDPDLILQQGIEIGLAMQFNLGTAVTLGLSSLMSLVPSLIFVLSFTVIAATLLITLIESYLVISGGILLLGFAGSRWTATFAEGYLLYAMRVGVKLFVLYLLVGVGMTFPQAWLAEISVLNLFDLRIHWQLMGNAVIFMLLVFRVPRLAAEMVGPRATFHLDRAYQEA